MSTPVAPDVVELEDLGLNLELPCEREGCETRPPAVWRVAPGVDHPCLTVQLWCDDCRVAHRHYEAHVRLLVALGAAEVVCDVCYQPVPDWKPCTITPIRGGSSDR